MTNSFTVVAKVFSNTSQNVGSFYLKTESLKPLYLTDG